MRPLPLLQRRQTRTTKVSGSERGGSVQGMGATVRPGHIVMANGFACRGGAAISLESGWPGLAWSGPKGAQCRALRKRLWRTGSGRRKVFFDALNFLYLRMANHEVVDYYLVCLSEHDQEGDDGSLGMWRAYGGNGSGAAIVFDRRKLGQNALPFLLLGKVRHGTTPERLRTIECPDHSICDDAGTGQARNRCSPLCSLDAF